jgi:hypothetical protein
MAPATGGMPGAGAGAGGILPGLTGGAGLAAGEGAGAATDPNAAAAAAAQGGAVPGQTAAGGAAPGGFDISKIASAGRWLGPLLAIGGGIAAFAAGKDGSKLMRWGGISAAISGVGLTAMGFKAKGLETGIQAGGAAKEAEGAAALNQMAQIAEGELAKKDQEILTLQQQIQLAAQQQGAAGPGGAIGAGQTPGPAGSGATSVGPGLDTTVVPSNQQGGVTGSGSMPTGTTPVGGTGATGGTPGATGTTAPQGTTPAGPWSVQSLVGQSVELAAGASTSGAPIADAGTFRIEQPAGDPNGYATLDEANAAARQTMSTELMGSKFLRWMVVEHEGRYYGAIAKQLPQGGQATPLTPQVGNVVAWSAMNHVSEGGASVNGWQAYSWSRDGGQQSIAVPYGTTNVFGAVSGGGSPIGGGPSSPTGTAPSGTTGGQVQMLPGTNIPVPGQQGVTPGGAVTGGGSSGAPFDPASQVGRSFSINASNTAEGDLARGGVLQVQKFVESSAGGFGTAEEAASAARAARKASGGDQWTRWVSMQGSDGRFYVYQGSIVKRPTTELESAPVHVFGVGFAEFFDASTNSWKAVRDAQAA